VFEAHPPPRANLSEVTLLKLILGWGSYEASHQPHLLAIVCLIFNPVSGVVATLPTLVVLLCDQSGSLLISMHLLGIWLMPRDNDQFSNKKCGVVHQIANANEFPLPLAIITITTSFELSP
jgi:hypothetical protein